MGEDSIVPKRRSLIRRFFSRALPLMGLIYLAGAAVPLSTFWYEPGIVVISDTVEGIPPKVEFWRHIKRPTMISFTVAVRRNDDAAPVCEGYGPAKLYRPAMGVLPQRDLEWWVGNDSCNNLPSGSYWAQTCWTAPTPLRALLPEVLKEPFGWLLPPKNVCRPNASESGNGYTFDVLPRTGR